MGLATPGDAKDEIEPLRWSLGARSENFRFDVRVGLKSSERG